MRSSWLCLRLALVACLAFGLFSMLAPAHAGSWSVTYSQSGTEGGVAYQDNPYGPDAITPADGNGFGISMNESMQADITDTVTATLTWTPATGETLQTDPPPPNVWTLETVYASWNLDSYGTGTLAGSDVSDGMGDPPISGPGYASSSGNYVNNMSVPASGIITLSPDTMIADSPTYDFAHYVYGDAADVNLTFGLDPNPDFAIGNAEITLVPGTTGTTSFQVTPINNFSGTVTLSITSQPGLTVSLSPTVVSLSGGIPVAVQVTVTAASSEVPSINEFHITGTGSYNGQSLTRNGILTVNIPGGFPGHDPTYNDPQTNAVCNGGGGDGSVSAVQNEVTGNTAYTIQDPIATRGLPLVNNITINTQAVEYARPMGNAAFTYDMHLVQQNFYPTSSNGSAVAHQMVVDADGTRLDFGSSLGGPQPGVFSTLSGTTLTNAGPPGAINLAGSYTYTFDGPNGSLSKITDPNGNVQTLAYNSKNQLTEVLDQNTSKSIEYTWTGAYISQVTEGGGDAVTQLTYTGDDLTGVTVRDKSGTVLKTIQLVYASNGTLTSAERDNDPNSLLSFNYSPQQAPAGSLLPYMPPASSSTLESSDTLTWSGAPGSNTPTTVTDLLSGGGLLIYNINATDWVGTSVTPQAKGATQPLTQTYGYDSQGLLTSYSDGAITEGYGYTPQGLCNRVTDPLGFNWLATFSGTDLQTFQDPIEAGANAEEQWQYSDSSLPHVVTGYIDAAGNDWTFSHNTYGQPTGVTPPAGSPEGSSSLIYNEANAPNLGYPQEAKDGADDTVTFDSYDPLSDLTSLSTYTAPGLGGQQDTTLFAYDGAQRLTQVTRPDGKTEQFVYVGRNLDHSIDEAGTTYYYTYCASCGALEGINGPLGWSLSWAHNGDHQLQTFTDADGHTTSYIYGQAQELTGVSYPDGSAINYLYDNQDEVRQVTDGRGHVIALTYDPAERLSGINYPTTGQPGISLGYDSDSRVTSVTDGVGTTTLNRFLNGWVASIFYNYGKSGLSPPQELDYTYYPDGLRQSMTWKNGGVTVGTWTYTYDGAGRLTGVTNPWNEQTSWAYDGESKLLSQSNANGTSVAYGYNNQTGWPTSITDYRGGSVLASYALTYDGGANTVGNLTGVQEADGSTVSYGYDALYRLTAEQRTGTAPDSHTFGYDLAGNLTSQDGQGFSYDAGNKITNSGYSYDGDGDLLTDGTSSYTWDDRSDLTSRTSGGVSLSYGYDARGLRVESSAGGGTFYIYDGTTLLGEISSNGTVQAAYTWGADGLVSERLVPASRSLWYAYGPQGETRQLTDSTGAVADTYVYSAYGQPLSATGSDANPFRYGGQYGYYTDSALPNGVVLCTYRWYDPNGGRWLSRDPAAYAGGSDLYAYCEGQPVGGTDPSGLGAGADILGPQLDEVSNATSLLQTRDPSWAAAGYATGSQLLHDVPGLGAGLYALDAASGCNYLTNQNLTAGQRTFAGVQVALAALPLLGNLGRFSNANELIQITHWDTPEAIQAMESVGKMKPGVFVIVGGPSKFNWIRTGVADIFPGGKYAYEDRYTTYVPSTHLSWPRLPEWINGLLFGHRIYSP